MSIRPKGKVLENISASQYSANGRTYTHYTASLGTDGARPIRIYAASLNGCKEKVEAWYKQRKEAGGIVASLSSKELADAIAAYGILKRANIDKSLCVIADEYAKRYGGSITRKRLTEAYDAYYARFTEDQTRTREIVKKRVGRFVAAFPSKFADEITTDMVKKHLASMGDIAPKTYNNHLCDIRTFFNWCMLKVNGFCNENPVADMEKRKVKSEVPECAEIGAVKALFGYVYNNHELPHRDLLLFRLALNYFAGMRVDETKRQSADDVRLEDGSILVRDPKGSQTGRVHFRVFRIDDCGVALREWMKVVDMDAVKADLLRPTGYDRVVINARRACKATFPDNAGRHSFISYHVAAFGEPKRTEGIVGTGDDMRKCSYQSPRTKADGEAYFSITPSSVASKP